MTNRTPQQPQAEHLAKVAIGIVFTVLILLTTTSMSKANEARENVESLQREVDSRMAALETDVRWIKLGVERIERHLEKDGE